MEFEALNIEYEADGLCLSGLGLRLFEHCSHAMLQVLAEKKRMQEIFNRMKAEVDQLKETNESLVAENTALKLEQHGSLKRKPTLSRGLHLDEDINYPSFAAYQRKKT